MRHRVWAASAIALAAGLGGCATITRGTTTQFTVDSSPPAAEVKTSTGFICPATPCTFKMPRKDAFVVTVSKTGFKPVETHIKSGLASNGTAGFLGNALVGGVIGAGVDLSTGAMNDLTPNPLHVTLEPVSLVTGPDAAGGAPTNGPSATVAGAPAANAATPVTPSGAVATQPPAATAPPTAASPDVTKPKPISDPAPVAAPEAKVAANTTAVH